MFNYYGRNYAQNEKGNRFYKQGDDDRYTRISQRAYEEAFAKFLEKTTEKIELEDDTNAIAEYSAEMAQEEAKEDAEDTQNTEAPAPASDAKKTPKKAKKNTRKKKVQVGGFEFQEGEIHLILTPKQVDFLKHLSDSSFWQQGAQSTLWIDILCDEITGQFEGKPMTVGAMVSTLQEKGILAVAIGRLENKKAKCIALTDFGQRIATRIGIV
jgi:hypothetical protein